jgi:hypothetical protein
MLNSYITQFCRVGNTLASHLGGWFNLGLDIATEGFLGSPFHPGQMPPQYLYLEDDFIPHPFKLIIQ